MKVRVYFSKEPDTVEIILKAHKISRQALDTIYELVWECEFKNILNAGRVWLKFKENEERPFGISMPWFTRLIKIDGVGFELTT